MNDQGAKTVPFDQLEINAHFRKVDVCVTSAQNKCIRNDPTLGSGFHDNSY